MLRPSVEDGVQTLLLDRPDKRNALSIELRFALADALRAGAEDDGVRCTLITGAGSAFCAGMDVSEFGTDPEGLVASTEAWASALRDHAKPLVAHVNGPALGGGFVLALLCDIRVAEASATFGFPEVERGIPASYGAARSALSRSVATDLALTGRVIDAHEALARGVVAALGDGAETAARIASLPPGAVARTLEWIRSDREDSDRLLAAEHELFRATLLG